MNRDQPVVVAPAATVPHERGDEPVLDDAEDRHADLFPTSVGMNRAGDLDARLLFTVPHERGDEPSFCTRRTPTASCSPRAWG